MRQEGLAQAADLFVMDAVKDLRTRPAPSQYTAPVQGSQMLGHIGLTQGETCDQFGHVLLTFHQDAHDSHAGRGRQQAEEVGCDLVHPVIETR